MLDNPFTPSEIASGPNDFFGRAGELDVLKRALHKGSVAIHGAIGIGKSSLLARTRLEMDGFGANQSSQSVLVVGHKDTRTIDEAARLILEKLVNIDERQRKITFKIGSLFEHESAEISRNFIQGRHLAALERLLDRESLKNLLRNRELLIIAVDEADKCPTPLAQLIRAISTQLQHQGIQTVRFLLAGVSPFYEQMLLEDRGLARFIYKTISLDPMSSEDATDLLQTKFEAVVESARVAGDNVTIVPDIIPRIVALSGGHPHILQLLGSYLLEHENEDPDGSIDSKDLLNSLSRICYEDRAQAYDATIHMLTLEHELENLEQILELAGHKFPTRILRSDAEEILGAEALKWLVDHDILTVADSSYYGLVDEFLRIRVLLDAEQTQARKELIERKIIDDTSTEEFAEAELADDGGLDAYDEHALIRGQFGEDSGDED
jgi:hypothetical protein